MLQITTLDFSPPDNSVSGFDFIPVFPGSVLEVNPVLVLIPVAVWADESLFNTKKQYLSFTDALPYINELLLNFFTVRVVPA